ncbi:hypothetical protein RM553_10485 [Zunongwangia sp. F363]|uniref:Uncharacterized protein n=1 Tax=Autumnicola tepida TaxID=3075595 RepID=A0ABU3CB38_9FLAO|nr:hypothetical protein [Zunongwangia sp. F363]MDT0643255.1 hypothetical protein [Zunongwangia sp. F363]
MTNIISTHRKKFLCLPSEILGLILLVFLWQDVRFKPSNKRVREEVTLSRNFRDLHKKSNLSYLKSLPVQFYYENEALV